MKTRSLCLQVDSSQSSIYTSTAWTMGAMVPVIVLIIKPFLSFWYSLSFRKDPPPRPPLESSSFHNLIFQMPWLVDGSCGVRPEKRRAHPSGTMGYPHPVSRLSPLPGDHAVVNHTAALSSLVISRFSQILASWPPRQKARERGQSPHNRVSRKKHSWPGLFI